MGRLSAILFGIVVGGGVVFFGFHYHLVRADEGHIFVKKQELAFKDAYVDVREWSPRDWQSHPQLVEDLVKKGRGDLIAQPSVPNPLRALLPGFETSSNENEDVERR